MTTPSRIEKRLVHRHHEHERFLREPEFDDGVPAFGIAVEENHHILSSPDDPPPLIVMLEIARQLSIATCHVVHGLPAGWHAIANHMRVEWHVEPLTVRELNSHRTRAVVRSAAISENTIAANAISFDIELYHRRRLIATAAVTASWATIREYRILRGRNFFSSTLETKQISPFLPGARRRGRSLLSELAWDCRDTFYFDHEADHIPGMVLAGAAIEAAHRLQPSATARFIDIQFNRYAELEIPVIVAAKASAHSQTTSTDSPSSMAVTFMQADHEVCRATVGTF